MADCQDKQRIRLQSLKLIPFTDFNHDACIFVVRENFSIDYVFNHIDLLLQLVKSICLSLLVSLYCIEFTFEY